MTWISKVMAVLMALVWLPMVSHCELEHLSGLEFLACSDHSDGAPHQDKDCETDICTSVESGHYKTEEASVAAKAPALQGILVTAILLDAPEIPFTTLLATSSVPSELLQRWQFTFALRPRHALPRSFPDSFLGFAEEFPC